MTVTGECPSDRDILPELRTKRRLQQGSVARNCSTLFHAVKRRFTGGDAENAEKNGIEGIHGKWASSADIGHTANLAA